MKEYGSYHILVHVHVFHFLCVFKTEQNCVPNQNRPRKKKTQYTVNIGLNFEGVIDKDIAKTHTGNYKLPELYILWFHINIR